MSFQPMQYLFAVSLALSLQTSAVNAQSAYDEAALVAAAELLKGSEEVGTCNPMIDPGCHVPVTGGGGPDGCTDCNPSTLLRAFRGDDVLFMPDSIEINGNRLKLLEENTGSGTVFSLPMQ